MSDARVYAVRNRISGALLSKDGPTVESLVSEADTRVARLADSIATFVAGRVALVAAWSEQPDEALFAGCKAIGEPAMNIAEVAEAAGLDAVGAVARGICVMLDGLVGRGAHGCAARSSARPGPRARPIQPAGIGRRRDC